MASLSYPRPRKSDTVEDWFGTKLPDPYDYFRDPKDPEVRDWVAKENALTDAWFSDLDVEAEVGRLKAQRVPEMYTTVTPWRGGYIASAYNDAGSADILLLDADFGNRRPFDCLPRKEGFDVFQVFPDPLDDRVLAVMGQYLGDPRPTCLVYDEQTSEELFELSGTFSMAWSKVDGRVYLSATKADPAAQESHTVFEAFDPVTREAAEVLDVQDTHVIFGNVAVPSDGRFCMMQLCPDYSVADWLVYDVVDGTTRRLTEEPSEWTYVDSLAGEHYFVTMTGTNNGSVIKVRADGVVETVLPESDRIILNAGMGVTVGFVAGGHLFVIGREDVSRRLVDVTASSLVELPSDMADLSWVGRSDDYVFLKYASFVDPPQLLAFDGHELARVYAVSDATHPDVVVEQRFAPSTGDGTLVPYYLVRRADATPDGTQWALMYAYGGYNIDMPPWYTEMVTSINVADWVEAGNVYVHANLRGGNEYGPAWHEAGMGMSKRHCYEDYIGVAEKVIADGWTSKGRIAITGCSNGGLLNSTLVTMRPDLWGCVIDSVPHTDMIHFAEDDRGPMYITEYGNPRASKEMFEYLLSYSPYHNVREVAYPPTYVQTGECDNNVPPYHGKKFAARMQELNRGQAPVLLRVLARGGHNRGGTPEEYWRTTAEMRLFIRRAMGE